MLKPFLILFLIVCNICAQNTKFYSGKSYGSEALFNPINVILNGSYDIIQLQEHNRKINSFNYSESFKNVFNNLGNPFHQIKKYGFYKFLSDEILPLHLTKKGAQWWPNYQLHLIGGGLTYASLKEWYDLHNFKYSTLFALTTVSFYHLLNEVVENGNYVGTNVDPIADIYFFDLGGIILFSFENIKTFFHNTLNLSDWSLQPSFLLNDGTLQNNGQYFSIKYETPFLEKWSLFYYFGMNGLLGVSHKLDKENSLSVGFGLRAKKLLVVTDNIHKHTVETTFNMGIFYDKNNSLMASLLYSGLTDNTLQLNVYPGFLSFKGINPGVWLVFRKDGNFLFGISTQYIPGIGISF